MKDRTDSEANEHIKTSDLIAEKIERQICQVQIMTDHLSKDIGSMKAVLKKGRTIFRQKKRHSSKRRK